MRMPLTGRWAHALVAIVLLGTVAGSAVDAHAEASFQHRAAVPAERAVTPNCDGDSDRHLDAAYLERLAPCLACARQPQPHAIGAVAFARGAVSPKVAAPGLASDPLVGRLAAGIPPGRAPPLS